MTSSFGVTASWVTGTTQSIVAAMTEYMDAPGSGRADGPDTGLAARLPRAVRCSL